MDEPTITIGILVWDGVELLDFAGPYEVFTAASELAGRDHPDALPLFHVVTLGKTGHNILTHAGLGVEVDHPLGSHPRIHVLIVPGGNVDEMLADSDVALWVARVAGRSIITASVCTGAFLLAQAGLLDGKRATTHWEDVGDLGSRWPTVSMVKDVRWVDEDSVVTAAGISAGIDMALHLVERLANRELALRTARHMEYDWTERRV